MKELFGHSKKHYPNEFGGFLIGHYNSDFTLLSITNYILPKIYNGNKYSFNRSTRGVVEQLKEFYNLEPKQFYVGEWHSHPNGPLSFSSTDLRAMNNIVSCQTVTINNPILLIIGLSKLKINNFRFYFYDQGQLLEYS